MIHTLFFDGISLRPARLCWHGQNHAGGEVVTPCDQFVQALTEFGFSRVMDHEINPMVEQEFPGVQYQRGDWLMVVALGQDFQLRSAQTRKIVLSGREDSETLSRLKLFILNQDIRRVNLATSGLVTEMLMTLLPTTLNWDALTPEAELAQTEPIARLANLVRELYLLRPDCPTKQAYYELNQHVLAMLARDQKFVARPIDDAFMEDFTRTFHSVRTRMLTGQIVTLVK